MTSAVQLQIEPTLSSAQARQVFDEFVRYGRTAANELAKSFGAPTKLDFIAEVKGDKVNTFLKESVKIVSDLEKGFNKSNAAQNGSLTSLRQQLNTAKKLRDSISKTSVEANSYGQNVLKINAAWAKQNQQVQLITKQLQIASGSSFFDRLRSSFDSGAIGSFGRSVSGVVNTFQSVGIVLQQINGAVNLFVNSVKNIQSIALTFESIGQGAGGAVFALQEASRIALNLGVDLKATRNGFQQLSPVILQSGGSLEDVSKVVQALSSRFAVFGKSADEARRITNAVVQAFSKGALRSEELNQQIAEADPAFRVDLAEALKISAAELNQWVEEGKVTAELLLKTIPLLDKSAVVYGKYGESASKAAANIGQLNVTVQGVQAQIATLNQLSLERTGELFLPLIKSIIGVQAAFTDLITNITKSQAFKLLADVVNGLGAGFLNVIKFIAKLIEKLLALLEPFALLARIITQNKTLMTILGTVVITLLTIKLLLMAKAAFLASAALGRLALSSLIGKDGVALIGTEIAKIAGKGKLLGGLGNSFKTLGGTIGNSLKFLGSSKSIFSPLTQGAKQSVVAMGQIKTAANPVNVALKAAFTNPGAAINALGTSIRQVVTTTAAWGKAAVQVATGTKTTTGAFKALNAQTIRYTGEAIKASTSTATFASRTQAAIGGLTGTTAGATKLTQVLGNVVRLAPKGLLWGLVFEQLTGAVINFRTAIEPSEKAFKQFSAIANDAEKNFSAFKQSIGQGGNELKNVSTRINGLQRAQESIVQGAVNVGLALFGVSEGYKVTSLEAASFGRQVAVIQQELARGLKVYEQQAQFLASLGGAYAQTAESRAQATQVGNAAVKQIDLESEAIEAQIRALKDEIPTTESGREAKELAIATLRAELNIRQANRKAIIAQTAAAGGDVSATDRVIVKKKELIATLETELAARKKVLEEAEKTAGKTRDTQIEKIDKANKATQKYYDDQIESINKTKSATDRRWAAEDASRTRSRQLADRTYDAEIARLDKVKAAVERAYQQPIAALQSLSPAESQLAELDKAELRKQAAQAETQRERLQAQAQLERIERDKQIAQLEAEKAKELEKIEAQKAAKEKERAEEKIRREDEDFAREEERRAKREAFEDRIMKLQEAAATAQAEADAQKQKAQDDYEAAIKPSQDAVLETTKKIDQANADIAARIVELQRQGKIYNNILNDELILLQKINAERRNAPPPPKGTGTTGGTRTNLPGGKWAGGPVSGGTTYTVNELGPEAFLSSTGKLSMIDAPTFGQWRAPGAGTVIPAHITAGLDIPSGGISVNGSAGAAATRSSGNPMASIASLLRSAVGAPQGRVTNNVTIQSQNPTKSASDILVEMTKIKRNRYR